MSGESGIVKLFRIRYYSTKYPGFTVLTKNPEHGVILWFP